MNFAFIKAHIKNVAGLSIAFIVLAVACVAMGDTMTSSHYSIQSDSINFGGGRSTSNTYGMENTLGEIATGISSSTHYTMGAGYQQMHEVVIAVTPATSVTLSPSIGGLSGGTSNGSTTFAVITDDPAGYTASIKASSTPALQSPYDSFADYAPSTSNPDFTFTNGIASSTFAFSPKGTDIASRYLDTTAVCGSGSSQTVGACWDGLSTSDKTIVSRSTSNHTSGGTVTTLNFRAAVGSSRVQTNGIYTATTTITILAQ